MQTDHYRLALIAAVDRNRLIGVDSERMPWHLPDDLKYFKRITLGKPVIMGRRTFESIGRPLPGRLNIVLTRGQSTTPIAGQLQIAADLDSARRLAEDWIRQHPAETVPGSQAAEVMVIGGAEVYSQALADADRLYLTEIDAEFVGNNHFPEFMNLQPGWTMTSRETRRGQTEADPDYAFVTYDRIR